MGIKSDVQRVLSLLQNNKVRDAIALIENCANEDPRETLRQLQSQGCLRASKYDFRVYKLTEFVQGLLNLHLAEWKSYLSSIQALLYFGSRVRGIFTSLEKQIEKDRTSRIKEALALVELKWIERTCFTLQARAEDRQENWPSTPEDLANCFSYYAYHALRGRDLSPEDLGLFNESNIVYGDTLKLLNPISSLLAYQDAEMFVDRLGFQAQRSGKRIIIKPPDEELGRSLALGFISTEISLNNTSFLAHSVHKEVGNLSKLSEDIFQTHGDKLVITKTPPNRLVVKLPEAPILTDILQSREYFQEEIAAIAIAQKEFFIDHNQFTHVPIYKSVTLDDILRFQRIFYFLSIGLATYIRFHPDTKTDLLARSIVPVMERTQLEHFISFAVAKDKVLHLIELFSYPSESSQGIFDVQYKPILQSRDYYMCASGLLAHSNLIRNALSSGRFRFDAHSDVDPVSVKLSEALKGKGFTVVTSWRFTFSGRQGEVDVLAYKDEAVFAFECKSSLHPVSIAELRTSFDYLTKAQLQLDRFCDAMRDSSFRIMVCSKLGIPNYAKFYSCVVTGNRMFCGYKIGSHPVRPVHTLSNFIENGLVRFEDGEVCVWLNNNFCVDDLVNYVQGNCLHDPMLRRLESWNRRFAVGGRELVITGYSLSKDIIDRTTFEKSAD